MSIETGKPISEARGGTLAASGPFEWNSEETKRIHGQEFGARTRDVRTRVIHQPVGVVAAFAARNFPDLFPARKFAAALVAGCSIMV